MATYIRIEDYFKDIYDQTLVKEAVEIRNELNSFRTVGEQYSYLVERRSSKENRKLDYRIFGIKENAKLYDYYEHEKSRLNQYYQYKTDKKEVLENKHQKTKGVPKFDTKKLITCGVCLLIILAIILIFIIASLFARTAYLAKIFKSTPFKICDFDADPLELEYLKYYTDEETGRTYWLPGNVYEYGTYLEDREKLEKGEPLDHEIIYHHDNYGAADSDRGYGQFSILDTSGRLDDEYYICMRWEYYAYTIGELNGAGYSRNSTFPFNDQIVALTNTFDSEYEFWLRDQKFIIFNPENNKSCLCYVYKDEETNECLWGPDNAQDIGLMTSEVARVLQYDPSSLTQLDVYFVPDYLQDADAGDVSESFTLTDDGCEFLQQSIYRTGGGVGNLIFYDDPNIPHGTGDYAAKIACMLCSNGKCSDNWYDTITELYKSYLTKWGLAYDAQRQTSCATFASIVLAESFGDVTPTAGSWTLWDSLNNNPNYVKFKFDPNVPIEEQLEPGDCMIAMSSDPAATPTGYWADYTKENKIGHCYIYAGDITGDPNKPFVSASMLGWDNVDNDVAFGPILYGDNNSNSGAGFKNSGCLFVYRHVGN